MSTVRGPILAIDEGTTNTKAFLVDSAGSIVKEASRPVSIAYPQPAWLSRMPGKSGGRRWRPRPRSWKVCPPGK